ncbi:P-loop containing nucleoside triphosphate hydrolase protein [Penicillium angulare]|uniref:P-loop containing nucleoside triphosphate hydrolase protein n=1 Tax=Penicillium angulare TaxID=116970 RepID=UPI002540672D|nr:P-loop containing nucleoside triphosphate hydrolase protein [Penicillium angulare]KAJ5273156.1 P-loop containing nucleoside triphosphate hydrolase protein [Penicillium angulare]
MYRIRDKSPETLIFWIYANSAARFNQCYRDIADNFDIPYRDSTDINIFHVVHDWLEKQQEKWIIVLDGMDSDSDLPQIAPTGSLEGIPNDEKKTLSNPLKRFLPQGLNGSVLLTTRSLLVAKEIVTSDGFIGIEPMSEPLAMALFHRKLGRGSNGERFGILVKKLNFHPLAVVQAALLIKSQPPQLSISTLCERLDAHIPIQHTAPHSHPLHSILNIAFNHIRQTRPAAFELLSLMSFFEPQEIPKTFFETRGDNSLSENDESIRMKTSTQSLNQIYQRHQPRTELDASIDILADLSLIYVKDSSAITMHGSVQQELKRQLKLEGLTNQWIAQSIKCLCYQLAEMNFESTSHWRFFFPHVKAMIKQRPIPDQSESLLKWATLLHRGSRYAWTISETVDMKRMATAAAEVRRELLGPDDPETIDAFTSVILAYLLLGQWCEAELLAEQQSERCSRVLGDEHRISLFVTGQLALAKWYQGRWDEAELPSLKLLDIARRTLGEEHPDTLSIMSNIAATYDNQGRWDEAERLNSQVYERRLRILGTEHPDTLTSKNNLSVIYEKQGQLEKARTFIIPVFEIRRDILGAEHPDTLSSMSNLASVYHAQGEFSRAEELSLQLLDIYRRLRGIQHRDTLVGMDNLARIYRAQDREDEAEVLAVKVIEGRQKILGLNHPDTLMSQVSLGAIYSSQRRWDEAEAIQEQALKGQQITLGLKHPDVFSSMDSLASIYRSQRRLAKANAMYRQLITTLKAHLGSDHTNTAKSLGKLALVLLDQGNFEEAELLQKQSVEVLEKALGPDHPVVLEGTNTLALIFTKQKRPHEAEKVQRRVVSCRKRILGMEHGDTLDSMEILAVLLFDMGQWEEAEGLAKAVTQFRAKEPRKHSPDATKATLLLQQISQMKLAQGISPDEDDNSDISEFGSVISSLSIPGSSSSTTSINNSIVTSAVEVFTASLLGMESFQQVCRFALEESGYSKKRIRRNLKKALGRFASHLTRDPELGVEPHVIKFFRGAQLRIASLTMQSLSKTRPSGLEESNIRRVEEESSRAKVLDYLQTREDTSQLIQSEQFAVKNSEPDIQGKPEGRDELDSDSDSEADSIPDAPEIAERTLVDDLQRIEHLIFQSNAFQMMEREFHDFVFPSMRSILFKWILEKRRNGEFMSTQLLNLEVVVSELQHVPPDKIALSFDEDTSILNTIKGLWEAFTAERWDWWPLRPYMRALGNDEARLHWQCVSLFILFV